MDNHKHIEQELEKKLKQRDKRKRKRMHQSGKSVLKIARIIKAANSRTKKTE